MCTNPKITKEQINLSNSPDTCRVCMRKNNSMKQLFGFNCKVVDRIQFCTGILFTDNPNLPSLICTECLSHLDIAYNFKTKCIASDVMFKKLDVNVEIKTEILDPTVKEEVEDIEYLYEDIEVQFEDEAQIEDLKEDVGLLVEKRSNLIKNIETPSPNYTIKIENQASSNTAKVENQASLNYISTSTIELKVICKEEENPIKKNSPFPRKKRENKDKEKKPRNKYNRIKFRKLYCGKCNIRFETKEESIEHHETVHNTSKYVCEVCGKQFVYQSAHTAHKRIHIGRSYACAHCSYTTVNKEDLKTHLTLHTGEKKYQCHACPMKFSTSSNMHRHIKYKHGGQNTFHCDRCNKSFHKTHMKRHMDAHNKIKRHVCPVCHSRFSLRAGWKRHLLSHHAVTVPRAKPGPRNTNLVIESTPSIFEKDKFYVLQHI